MAAAAIIGDSRHPQEWVEDAGGDGDADGVVGQGCEFAFYVA